METLKATMSSDGYHTMRSHLAKVLLIHEKPLLGVLKKRKEAVNNTALASLRAVTSYHVTEMHQSMLCHSKPSKHTGIQSLATETPGMRPSTSEARVCKPNLKKEVKDTSDADVATCLHESSSIVTQMILFMTIACVPKQVRHGADLMKPDAWLAMMMTFAISCANMVAARP